MKSSFDLGLFALWKPSLIETNILYTFFPHAFLFFPSTFLSLSELSSTTTKLTRKYGWHILSGIEKFSKPSLCHLATQKSFCERKETLWYLAFLNINFHAQGSTKQMDWEAWPANKQTCLPEISSWMIKGGRCTVR